MQSAKWKRENLYYSGFGWCENWNLTQVADNLVNVHSFVGNCKTKGKYLFRYTADFADSYFGGNGISGKFYSGFRQDVAAALWITQSCMTTGPTCRRNPKGLWYPRTQWRLVFGKCGGVQAIGGGLRSDPRSSGQDGTQLVLHVMGVRATEKVYKGQMTLGVSKRWFLGWGVYLNKNDHQFTPRCGTLSSV